MHRIEKDITGHLEIDRDALYGIHSHRAKQNFPDHTRFSVEWYKAMGTIKKCIYLTCRDFNHAVENKFNKFPQALKKISVEKLDAMIHAAQQVEDGNHFEHFIVPAISGGAGTSINMNVNEIISNLALLELNRKPGDYDVIHPIEHANIYQSTNDVVPTSLKVALLRLLEGLEKDINTLRAGIEKLEKQYRYTLRIGFTQMQEAVPTTFGRLLSTYNEALSRDWWRVSKCFERIKTVNLGGSAVGTGLAVPRYFIFETIKKIQQQTGLPVSKAENLADQTSNLDSLVEIHAILKAHAVNLEKMTNDFRLLSSDLAKPKTLDIPAKQTGSSIMPGKINPVITEFTVSATHRIYANDSIVSSLSAQGCLDLNAYLPVIGHSMIESITLLQACNKTIHENLVAGISIHEGASQHQVLSSPGITAALVPYIGYSSATELAVYMKGHQADIFEANRILQMVPEDMLTAILKPENIIKEGFSIKDILDYEKNKGE